jgi:hypothetical protein
VLEERPEVFQRLARGGLQVPEEAGRESGVVDVNFFLFKKKSTDRKNIRTASSSG